MMRTKRRDLLRTLGLGAGGLLLGPLAASLISEARGQVPTNRRFVVFLVGNGLTPEILRPADRASGAVLPGVKDFAWPAMVAPLAPYRDRMLLIDGLANEVPHGQHSGGYAALSGATSPDDQSNEYDGPPGDITLDQHLAATLSAGCSLRSVLCGVDAPHSPVMKKVFASARNTPEPHYGDPARLFDYAFGAVVDPAASGRRARREQLLLDSLRGDIQRLRARLAGEERQKLDAYLAVIEDFAQRQEVSPPVDCAAPTAPSLAYTADGKPPAGATTEDLLDALVDIGSVAISCGMTRVMGVSVGCGMSHQMFPKFQRLARGTPYESDGFLSGAGHDAPNYPAQMTLIHAYVAGLVKRVADTLANVPEGNGTALDNTTMLVMSDCAEAHHSSRRNWPLYVLGNAGGALRADGRFLAYPKKGSTGWRSTTDLFLTIAQACGAPLEGFGSRAYESISGPLSELT